MGVLYMKKLRWISTVLVLVIFATTWLTGCVQTKDKGAETTRSIETTDNDVSKDPIRVIVFNNSGGGTGAGSEAGSTKESYKAVQDHILQETGVLVESIKPPSSETEQKLAAMLSSGEQLDLWWGKWTDYAADGVIQPLNDAIKKHGPNIHSIWEKWDAWGRVTDSKGVIWGIPRYTQFASYFTFVRSDWLKLLNMEIPKTFSELEQYLYEVKKLEPYGKGETIPLIARGGNVQASLEWAFLGGFTKAGRSQWLDKDDNVMPKELQEGYSDFIATLAKWYKDGIIHKENFSWNAAKVRDYISSGRVGASAAYYTDITQFTPIMQKNLPEADFAHNEDGMIGPNGEFCQTLNPGASKQMLISSKVDKKRLTALMKVIDWSFASWENYQICNFGIEGIHWKYDTTVVDEKTAREQSVVSIIPNSGYYADFCLSIGLPYESQGYIYNADGKRNKHNLYLAEYLDDFHTCKKTLDAKITYNTKELQENIPSLSAINTTINEELVKFVKGQRSMDTWDEFIQSLYKIGLDDWIKEHTRQYNELTGK